MDRALLKCICTVISHLKATITRSIIDVLNIFNFADLVFLHNVLALFKCIKSTESVNNTYFTFLSDISSYSTRDASNFKLCLNKFNLSITNNSFLAAAPRSWNSLPNNITAASNIYMFCNTVYSHLCLKYA